MSVCTTSEIHECGCTPNHVVLFGRLQLATAGSSYSTPPPSIPNTYTNTYDILRSHLRCSAGHFFDIDLGLERGQQGQRCNLCVRECGSGGLGIGVRVRFRSCGRTPNHILLLGRPSWSLNPTTLPPSSPHTHAPTYTCTCHVIWSHLRCSVG